ncbi:MAG: hypothetical protein ACTSRX_09770 [Promethearchaeota archaeon]
MTNQGNETELKRALEEGNLITVGQKSISKDNEEELVFIDSKINKTFFKYNLPIGIDFGKSLKPYNFLTSLEILDRTLQIPKISEKKRFKLENLRLYLTTGKIWHYKHELNSFLKEDVKDQEDQENKKDEKDKKQKSHDVISENHFISLLISLNFILNQASTSNIKWVSKNQILKYINSLDHKTMLSEWKTNNFGKLPDDTIFLSLISQTLIQQKLLLDLSEDQKNNLKNLKKLAISAKFSKIRQIVASILKTISPLYLSFSTLADDSIEKEKLTQNQLDLNDIIIYRNLDTLNILQNE